MSRLSTEPTSTQTRSTRVEVKIVVVLVEVEVLVAVEAEMVEVEMEPEAMKQELEDMVVQAKVRIITRRHQVCQVQASSLKVKLIVHLA